MDGMWRSGGFGAGGIAFDVLKTASYLDFVSSIGVSCGLVDVMRLRFAKDLCTRLKS